MTKRKNNTLQVKLEPPVLVVPHKDAEEKIQDRINIGNDYYNRSVRSEKEYDELVADVKRWSAYNHELLIRIFSNESVAVEYSKYYGGSVLMNSSWQYWLNEEKEKIADKTNRLKAIKRLRPISTI